MNHNSDETMAQRLKIYILAPQSEKIIPMQTSHLQNNIKAGLVTRTI